MTPLVRITKHENHGELPRATQNNRISRDAVESKLSLKHLLPSKAYHIMLVLFGSKALGDFTGAFEQNLSPIPGLYGEGESWLLSIVSASRGGSKNERDRKRGGVLIWAVKVTRIYLPDSPKSRGQIKHTI